ncbi:exonuclease domain-containing protein [Verrucomicrobiota bacterium]
MFKWKLDKPLAVFDIEATGVTPRADRIVELAIVKLMPNGKRSTHCFRVNPEMPIPAEAMQIHGITDADVASCPTFSEKAKEIFQLLEECDLAGYNILRFDIPMLTEEFLRADIKFDITNRRLIDAQRVFHKREPRDLSAALSFYCNEMHIDAHGAESDVLATIRVMEGQFEKYSDLPQDISELAEYCNPKKPDWVDRTGKLKWKNNEIVLNFSKKKGTPLKELIQNDSSFIKWILKSNFPRDMHEIIQNAMNGKWPEPPGKN